MRSTLILLALAMMFVGSDSQAADRADGRRAGPSAPLAFPDSTAIYRAAGVRDDGTAANVGIATTVHCTSFDSAAVTLAFVVRNYNAAIVGSAQFSLASLRTVTASTHATSMFNEDIYISPGKLVEQGSITINSTSPRVFCTLMMVDATSSRNFGVELRLIRLNPAEYAPD